MAKFIPTGWKMSPKGDVIYRSMIGRVDAIVRKRVRKYTLPATDIDDLVQEGRIAAAYAVDTFVPERGNLDGYIGKVVSNALAMVAAESLAQCRQPYKSVMEPDGTWRKIPINCVDLADTEVEGEEVADRFSRDHEALVSHVRRKQVVSSKLQGLQLSQDAQQVLELTLRPTPELRILARNMNRGRRCRIDKLSMARYLAWDAARINAANHELKDKMFIELGLRLEEIS